MQLVVCGMWRPVRLEGPEQYILVIQDSTDRREAVFRAHGPPSDQRTQALGEISRR